MGLFSKSKKIICSGDSYTDNYRAGNVGTKPPYQVWPNFLGNKFEKDNYFIPSRDLINVGSSGAGNYDQFWTTVSLRGMIACELRVDVLTEGVHSGSASGLVPSSFRILRQLISRVEDEISGEIKVEALHTNIPDHRINEVKGMVSVLNKEGEIFPWHENTIPSTDDPVEGILRRTWKPTLSTVGLDGVPAIKDGGNVLRPYTALKLSFRLPPDVECHKAMDVVNKILTENQPYNASITIEWEEPANGWNAPTLAPWLDKAIQEASHLSLIHI